MKLCSHSTARRLTASSQFIMQMYSPQIAQVLNCFSQFGWRVLPLIREQPSALEWWINDDVLIHRRHWFAMCRSVLTIVRLTGTVEHQGLPFCKELEAAAQAAVSLFGPFVQCNFHASKI